MELSHKNNLITIFSLITIIIVFVFVQILLINKYNFASSLLVIANGLLFSLIFYIYILKRYLAVILISLSSIPLLYLSLEFHYSLPTIIVQDLPLILLTIIILISSVATVQSTKIRLDTISLPVIFLILYAPIMVIIGYKNGNPNYYNIEELYHVGYYFLFFIFLKALLKREEYYKIFSALLIISIGLSLEYIFFNTFAGYNRFVSFQAYILPVIGSITFSMFLFSEQKFSIKLLWGFISLIIHLGIFITLTRTLWATSFISIGTILLFYWLKYKRYSKFRILVMTLVITAPLIYLGLQVKPQKQSMKNTNKLEYRSQSMTNPGEDRSFLMRMELGLYILQDFIKSPIWGNGLGASVRYKFLGITNKPIYYPDNSWLFFLWKGGLIGLLIFIWIYYRAVKLSWYIIMRTKNQIKRSLFIGILAGLIGLFFLGLFNAVLIKYKITFIFPILLSYIEFEYRNYHSELLEEKG